MLKRICLYGILASVCIVLGYIEFLLNFDLLVPGLKIGLSNSVVLLLAMKRDFKGAALVNITRIIISALLFSSPMSLIYSLAGAVISMTVVFVLAGYNGRLKIFSTVGLSIIGAVMHNIAQLAVAALVLGNGVFYYAPVLLIAAVIAGIITGIPATIVLKRSDL